MSKKELFYRYLFFLVGLFVNSFGVSFITKANLGTSPISSIPYTLSIGFPPTLGMFTLYFSILLIALQMAMLRKKFPKQYWLQLPVSVAFSYFIDVTMNLLQFFKPQGYIIQVLSLLAGCFILGIGVFMEMAANVVMLPGECFVNAISHTFHTDFGKTKVAFDSSMTLSAAVVGLFLYHRLAGVREGTVVAAVLVGMIARFLNRKIGGVLNDWFANRSLASLDGKGQNAPYIKPVTQPLVITISREYGSNGRIIAKKLAEDLGLSFYDHDIISLAAKEMHLQESKLEAEEQELGNSFLYDLVSQVYNFSEQEPPYDKLFNTEIKLIQGVAQKGNCVIVGRCSDYICRTFPNSFHVFLYANEEYKTRVIMDRENMAYKTAQRHVREINKRRFLHYKYYTGRIWGLAINYNLCVDTGKMGIEKTVQLIEEMLPSNWVPAQNKLESA